MNDAATIGHNQGPPLDDRPAGPRSLPADRAKLVADALREMATAYGRLQGPERDAAVLEQARQLKKVGLLNLAAVIEEGAPIVPVILPVHDPRVLQHVASKAGELARKLVAQMESKELRKLAARRQRDTGQGWSPGARLIKADYEARFFHRCEMCGQEFASGRPEAKTCSPACRTALYRKNRAEAKPTRWNVLYSRRGKPSEKLGTFDTEEAAEAFARIEQAKIKPGANRSFYVHVVMARERTYRKRKRAR